MNNQIKNYIGFLLDESSSMLDMREAALKDYNANITAVKNAANENMQDTIVSAFGFGGNGVVTKRVVNSNPHVLKPLARWTADGCTPLYDAIGDMIDLFKAMPDYDNPNVSFLVWATTDGQEYRSRRYTKESIANKIAEVARDERWTFVFRVPSGYRKELKGLGIPDGNIQEWDVTVKGLEASTAVNTQAVNNYYTQRSQGLKSSNVFYANANNVSTAQVKAALEDISAEVSMWTVLAEDLDKSTGKAEIKPFCEKRLGRAPYLKGAAFYQLSKTEPVVQGDKLIIIRDKATGRVYHGDAARDMIGLPRNQNARVKVGDFGNYDVFIQSKSINRHLVVGTQVLYWPKIGEGFTAKDFPWLSSTAQTPQGQNLQAASIQAIQATQGIQPTAQPVVKKPVVPANAAQYFASRDHGRAVARAQGKSLKDAGKSAPAGMRWYI